VRFGIIGAGPAGLYLAILLKRDDPTREVEVVERNPPDATFGWGVVFSEDTLTELRDADYETFVALDDELVRWSAIDIHYRQTMTRSYGHGFSAVRRTSLLRVLQDRARQLGVRLAFEEEVSGPEIFADCDVVVGADGVNSTVRGGREETFGTRVHEHKTRFAWFGTDHVFDVFTFVFRESAHGLFTVHAYPFDADASTFIVECREETWRRAGLDVMTEEESLAYCENLFGDVLDGGRLMSNRSIWTTFLTIRNRSWHDDNIVLAGDAAHTAHFSIGSGTKLAVEDAIALAKAFTAHGDDLGAVFSEYELERQIPVERFQDAAVDSAHYFATVSRFVGFSPEQFAFNLLTRSGRITHRSLEQRDPAVVSVAGRWFAADATGDPREASRFVRPNPAQTKLRLGTGAVANRVVIASEPTDTAENGRPGPVHAGQIAGAVDAGVGLVVTEMIAVSGDGRISPGSPGLYEKEHVEA
jgi:anthraniloyl-CoA monooxygenase